MRKKWLILMAAISIAGGLSAMYVYERNRQHEIEAMLFAALEHFHAESATSTAAPE